MINTAPNQPDKAPPTEQARGPVFVDATGRRSRALRGVAVIIAFGCSAYMAMLRSATPCRCRASSVRFQNPPTSADEVT